jgi:hypothetical protein
LFDAATQCVDGFQPLHQRQFEAAKLGLFGS